VACAVADEPGTALAEFRLRLNRRQFFWPFPNLKFKTPGAMKSSEHLWEPEGHSLLAAYSASSIMQTSRKCELLFACKLSGELDRTFTRLDRTSFALAHLLDHLIGHR
jgi:hypothetical protein